MRHPLMLKWRVFVPSDPHDYPPIDNSVAIIAHGADGEAPLCWFTRAWDKDGDITVIKNTADNICQVHNASLAPGTD